MKFGKIAGARNVVFFNTNRSSGARKVTSVAWRVADWRKRSRNVIGSFSDHARIGRALEMTFQLFFANFCQMLHGYFAWQAQYLVSLEGDICFSAHWKWRFICDEDQACESFCVAGAVLGEGQVSLFVVGAVLGEGQVSLFVVGAVLGEVQVSLCVVGAVLGEVQVSLSW